MADTRAEARPSRHRRSGTRPSISQPLSFVLLLGLGAVVAGFAVETGVLGPSVGAASEVAWVGNLLVVSALLGWSTPRVFRALRQDAPLTGTGSLVVGLMNLFAIAIPAATLVWRSREPLIERLLGVEVATDSALTRSLSLAAGASVCFWLGEFLASRRPPSSVQVKPDANDIARGAATILLVAGTAIHLAELRAGVGSDFATRGEAQGEGLKVVLGWGLALGVAVSVQYSHWGSKLRVFASVVGIGLLVAGGVRSPLLLVAVAALPRVLQWVAKSRRPALLAPALLVAANVVLAVGAGLSTWRGSIRANQPVGLFGAIREAFLSPLSALTQSGIDTLDGLLFVDRYSATLAHFRLSEFAWPVLSLIPRQIFPSKPELLTNIISREYLGFGTAGMFMSGPGYMWLILGSVAGALIAFVAIGFGYGRVSSRPAPSVRWLIATYFVLRFFIGGSAFDVLLTLELAGLWLVAAGVSRFLRAQRPAHNDSRTKAVAKR